MDQKLSVAEVTDQARGRKHMGDLDALAASMRTHGLLQPIGVRKGGSVIYGRRRLAAARLLGWDSIDARVYEVDDIEALLMEKDENENREELPPSDKVALAREIEKSLVGRKRGKKAKEEPHAGTLTRDLAAEVAGFTSTTAYRRAAEVVDKAPDLIDAMDTGKIPVDVAAEAAVLKVKHRAAFLKKVEEGEQPRAALKAIKPAKPKPKQKTGDGDAEGAAANGQEKPNSLPEPDILVDGLGRTIPDAQKDIFGASALREIQTEMDTWVLEFTWAPLVQRLDLLQTTLPFLDLPLLVKHFSDMETALNLALETLKQGKPYAVCPKCEGNGGDCPDCRGGGHLPEWRALELGVVQETAPIAETTDAVTA